MTITLKFKHAAFLLALCGTMQAASAQDKVVQDGIAVKPLKGGAWRDITAPEKAINEQSARSTRP
jgi:hypothetical protein